MNRDYRKDGHLEPRKKYAVTNSRFANVILTVSLIAVIAILIVVGLIVLSHK